MNRIEYLFINKKNILNKKATKGNQPDFRPQAGKEENTTHPSDYIKIKFYNKKWEMDFCGLQLLWPMCN